VFQLYGVRANRFIIHVAPKDIHRRRVRNEWLQRRSILIPLAPKRFRCRFLNVTLALSFATEIPLGNSLALCGLGAGEPLLTNSSVPGIITDYPLHQRLNFLRLRLKGGGGFRTFFIQSCYARVLCDEHAHRMLATQPFNKAGHSPSFRSERARRAMSRA